MPSQMPIPSAALMATPKQGGSHAPIFSSPLEDDEDHIDATHDNTLLCYRTIYDILGDQEVIPRSVQRNIDVELHLTHIREPCSL
jgi:hypothetical protein